MGTERHTETLKGILRGILNDTERHCETLRDTVRHCETLRHTLRH